MSNYTRSTNFTAKDALASGNPSKIILGSEHDAEYDAIATAISSKVDNIGTQSAETSIDNADSLVFYDNSASTHKRILVSNLKTSLDIFNSDSSFFVIQSTSPVVVGFTPTVYNSMAGYGNATESFDSGSLVTNWKLTPGDATSQTWLLGVWATLAHGTTFSAGTTLQLYLTRFNSSNVAQSRITIAQDNNPDGLTYSYLSGSVFHNISSATDYFTVESYANQGNYNMYSLIFWGMRVR